MALRSSSVRLGTAGVGRRKGCATLHRSPDVGHAWRPISQGFEDFIANLAQFIGFRPMLVCTGRELFCAGEIVWNALLRGYPVSAGSCIRHYAADAGHPAAPS